jgi:hypothetical protein
MQVGLSSVTAKILCEKHNNDLSPVDTAGEQAFSVFRDVSKLSGIRAKLKVRLWRVKTYKIDGKSLERWYLKTLVNLCYDQGHAIGRDSSHIGRSSDRLVRIAYGLESFKHRAGLYSVTRSGMNITSTDKVEFMPLFKNNLNVEAAIFMFRGFMNLLYLEEDGPPERLTGIYMDSEHIGDSQLVFHCGTLDFKIGPSSSQKVHFKW